MPRRAVAGGKRKLDDHPDELDSKYQEVEALIGDEAEGDEELGEDEEPVVDDDGEVDEEFTKMGMTTTMANEMVTVTIKPASISAKPHK